MVRTNCNMFSRYVTISSYSTSTTTGFSVLISNQYPSFETDATRFGFSGLILASPE